jgi:hypothetical protein
MFGSFAKSSKPEAQAMQVENQIKSNERCKSESNRSSNITNMIRETTTMLRTYRSAICNLLETSRRISVGEDFMTASAYLA